MSKVGGAASVVGVVGWGAVTAFATLVKTVIIDKLDKIFIIITFKSPLNLFVEL
ncbi:hypothetical protein [Candidatus Paracaedibacter symbiosus]|uniref:hypothetical protein n=1 Tax=Candidatus Paracaedibacter symbiosus TaxID=244582 RepID=UPI0012ECAC2C|nr:hypothetical protein [Candidatus Paracaedibacter symbiosus]